MMQRTLRNRFLFMSDLPYKLREIYEQSLVPRRIVAQHTPAHSCRQNMRKANNDPLKKRGFCLNTRRNSTSVGNLPHSAKGRRAKKWSFLDTEAFAGRQASRRKRTRWRWLRRCSTRRHHLRQTQASHVPLTSKQPLVAAVVVVFRSLRSVCLCGRPHHRLHFIRTGRRLDLRR